MRKKCLIAMAAVSMALAAQFPAYAVGSTTTSPIVVPSRPSGSGSSSSTSRPSSSSSSSSSAATAAGPGTVTINESNVPLASGPLAAALGFHTTTLATSTGVNGSTVSVVAAAQSAVTAKGEVISNDLAFSFANGEAATAGLITPVVDIINKINAGEPLDTTLSSSQLKGYKTLTSTHALIAKDPTSSEVKLGSAPVQLYVPNLVEGLGNVSVLYYDNATGQWLILPATVDVANKLVTVNVTGSGTLTVIYK